MHGISVTLINRVEAGKDDFNAPVYTEVEKLVENVLVAPTALTEPISDTSLDAKKIVFTLGIPKGDTNDWHNCRVKFTLAGQEFDCESVGFPRVGIESLVPTPWHKQVRVECYG